MGRGVLVRCRDFGFSGWAISGGEFNIYITLHNKIIKLNQ